MHTRARAREGRSFDEVVLDLGAFQAVESGEVAVGCVGVRAAPPGSDGGDTNWALASSGQLRPGASPVRLAMPAEEVHLAPRFTRTGVLSNIHVPSRSEV